MASQRVLRWSVFFLGILLTASMGGCGSEPPHPEEKDPAPVRAEPAKKMELGHYSELLGTTQPLPNHSARISAIMEGHVLSVLGDGKGKSVVEGQQVEAGQLIVQLDDRVLRANRDRLRATLHDLEEQQKQAGYALELATIDVQRLEELQQGKSGTLPLVSRVELEKARVTKKDAESKQQSALAKQKATTADLKAIDKQLEFFALRTPIAGRLGIVQAVPGQTLAPGTVVAEVVDLGEIDVLCYAAPDTAAQLALEQPAQLIAADNPSAEPGKPLIGKVVYVGVQAQLETGNIAVKVRFPNPKLTLRANAVVRVNVLTRPEQERLTIPETALIEDSDIPTVVVAEDVKTEKKGDEEQKLGKARILQAIVGIRDRDRHVVEIVGLQNPETKQKVGVDDLLFITTGGQGLKKDDVVKLQTE